MNKEHGWLEFVPKTLQASPLYAALWEELEKDPELLTVMKLVSEDQPNPITFFTTVNFLVLAEPENSLARYYPYLHDEAPPPYDEAYLHFKNFVNDNEHRKELCELLLTARLQTNEVTRCANLLPAFSIAYKRGGSKPLDMIEIGSSAGLNLLWNQYYYQYDHAPLTENIAIGNVDSPVHISCELRGGLLPLLPHELPRVGFCQGIELVPRDVYDNRDMRWIRAAIWPEELSRHKILDAAIQFARETPFLLHNGDACERLPTLLSASPGQTSVVWHSFAVNQGPFQIKEQIEQQIAAASHRQTIYRISLEVVDQSGPQLELITYEHGERVNQEHLANCAFHGEHMTWLL